MKNTKLRPDLALKMKKLDEAAVSEEELRIGVTKLKYMQVHLRLLCCGCWLGWVEVGWGGVGVGWVD